MPIELKTLTEEQRTRITIQCESFFLSYNKHKQLQDLHTEILTAVDKKLYKELWLILTALAKAHHYNVSGVLFSLNKPSWVKANRATGQALNLNRCKDLLAILEELGYLTLYIGFKDVDAEVSSTSCVLFSDKMFGLLPDNMPAKFIQKRDSKSFVEVRSSQTKESIENLRGFTNTKLYRQEMEKFNDLLSKTDVRLGVTRCAVQYKRIFSDNLSSGGRFYSFGSFQTIPSDLRETLTINGEKVTECDISQLHPSTLMHWEGVPYDPLFEAYNISREGLDITLDDKQWRILCKHGLLYMINANSRLGAANSLYNKLHRKPKSVSDYDWAKKTKRKFKMLPSEAPSKKTILEILKRLEEHNSAIQHRFYEDMLWAKLQYVDSDMSRYVLMKFTGLGIALLPYHDSYVCQKKHRQLLIDTMYEAWEHVMGNLDHCKVTVKF